MRKAFQKLGEKVRHALIVTWIRLGVQSLSELCADMPDAFSCNVCGRPLDDADVAFDCGACSDHCRC